MKKRLTCLLIGTILLLSVLMTGCSGGGSTEEDIADAAARETQTLVVYLMCEKAVDSDTESTIEDAINTKTRSKFKTELDIRFVTEDKYYTEIEAKLAAKEKEIKAAEKVAKDKKKYEKWLRESCKQAGISYVPATTKKVETVATEEATLVDKDYGIIRYVYPEPEANQIDIFYVGGYDKYNYYYEEDWLAQLDDQVSTSSKKLNEHIPTIYMTNIKDDKIFGIPTNGAIGEYTWMLLNKELMTKYCHLEQEIDYLIDASSNELDRELYNFLADVNDNERENFVPVFGELKPSNTYYWTINPETLRLTNSESVIGYVYTAANVKGNPMFAQNLFANEKYTNQLKAIKRFELEGFYATEEEIESEKPFAMGVIKGGYDIYQQYSEDYYVKMVECPRADEDDVYENMICVNALEENVSRAMEIVTYINTESEPRNILQYGIEGENYYIEDGVLHRFNQSYMMDVNKTGNVFMAHPEEGLPADYWDQWVQQNESAKAIPVFGFRVNWNDNPDVEKIAALEELYDVYYAEYEACTTLEEVDELFARAKAEINANEDFKFVKNQDYYAEKGHEKDPVPLMKIYYDWLVMKYKYGQ